MCVKKLSWFNLRIKHIDGHNEINLLTTHAHIYTLNL